MTTARQGREHGTVAQRDAAISERVDLSIRMYNRARRRSGQRIVSQEAIARQVFGRNADWLSKRLLGQSAFTTSELIDIGDFLTVNILDWIEPAKRQGPSPNGQQVTQAYITPYVASSRSIRDGSAIGKDHLVLLESA